MTPTTPELLTARIAAGEPLTILDVRQDASWTIEGPGVTVRHAPGGAVPDDLEEPVVVVCHRGVTAIPVAEGLQAAGVDASPLEGGMRGWIATLTAHEVDLGVPGLAVRQVQRPGRGCLSYVLAAGGRALVVDPAPGADYYVALADQLGARVTDVVDTHIHADHLSGARALAARTGAVLRLPAASLERGIAYEVSALHDGDVIDLGGIPVRAVALPGHTSDMTGLVVADRALLSGDSLFADGIARPDLQRSDPDGARAMARTLFATLHERILALGDDVVLLPGHDHPGVRRAAVAPRLGDVRVPELAIDSADTFAEVLVADMPPRPANYESVIAVNSGKLDFDPELETGGNSCSAS